MADPLRRFAPMVAALALAGCEQSFPIFHFEDSVDTTTDGAAIVPVGVSKTAALSVYTGGGMESYTDLCLSSTVRSTDPSVADVAPAGEETPSTVSSPSGP